MAENKYSGNDGTWQKGRLIYIEPNNFAEWKQKAEEGVKKDNISWNQEDLQYYVDLEVVKPLRDDCGQENIVKTQINEFGSGVWSSFLSGEEIATGTNCLTDAYAHISYQEYSSKGKSSKELLGIDSIDIQFDSHFFPVVTMKFTDVRGASLFSPTEYNAMTDQMSLKTDNSSWLTDEEKEEEKKKINYAAQSFFSSLFHLPYPLFQLTIKGFYGDKVTFSLAVSEFKTSFNASNGNFDVTVKFIGYMYGLYTDIPMSFIFAAPYIEDEYWNSKTGSTFTFSDGSKIPTFKEFLVNYKTLQGKIPEVASKEKKQLSELNAQKNDLDNFKTAYETYFNKTYNTGNTYITQVVDDSGKCEYTCYLSEGLTNDTVVFDRTTAEAKKYFEYIAAFSTKYSNESSFNGVFADPNGDTSGTTVMKEAITGKTETTDNADSKTAKYYYTYKYRKPDENIDSKIEYINGLIEGVNEQIDAQVKDIVNILKDSLGWNPTLENVYRMIFAHIDAFLHGYHNICSIIYKKKGEEKRKKSYLGLTPQNSDISKKSDDSTFICPYPAFFKKREEEKGGGRELVYPTEMSNELGGGDKIEKMDEVLYVEKIISKIESCMTEMQQALTEIENFSTSENSKTDDTLEEDNGISFNTDFTPMCLTDIFYEGVNPYHYLEEERKNRSNEQSMTAEEVVYFILGRYLSIFTTNNNYNNLNYNGEKANYNIIGQDIEKNLLGKDGLKIDEPLKELIKKVTIDDVIKYCNKNKNLLYKLENEKINLPLDKIAVFFKELKTTDDKKLFLEKEKYPFYIIDYNKKSIENFIYKGANGYRYINDTKDFGRPEFGYPFITYKSENEVNGCVIRENGEIAVCIPLPETKINIAGYSVGAVIGATVAAIPFVNVAAATGALIGSCCYFLGSVIEKTVERLNVEKNVDITTSTLVNNGIDGAHCGMLYFGWEDRWGKNKKSEHLFLGGLKKTEVDEDGVIKYEIEESTMAKLESRELKAILFVSVLRQFIKFSNNPDFNFTQYNKGKLYYGSTILYKVPFVEILYQGAIQYFYDKGLKFPTDIGLFKHIKEHNSGLIDDYNNSEDCLGFFNYTGHLFGNGTSLMDKKTKIKNQCYDCFVDWLDTEFDKVYSILSNTAEWYPLFICEQSKLRTWTIDNLTDLDVLPCYKQNSEQEQLLLKILSKVVYVANFAYGMERDTINSEADSINFYIDKTTIEKIIEKLKEKINTQSEASATTVTEEVTQQIESKEKDENKNKTMKFGVYYTLKSMYDKWLCSYTIDQFTLNSPQEDDSYRIAKTKGEKFSNGLNEFNSFIFIDSVYNNIGDKFIVNPKTLVDIVTKYMDKENFNADCSVFGFMAEIAEENNLLFLALPIYTNIYSCDELRRMFTPIPQYGQTKETSSQKQGNSYLLIYTGEPSKTIVNDDYYQDDGIDLFGLAEDHSALSEEEAALFGSNSSENSINSLPAFGVTFAKQNQMYFKNITVNMDNPKITDVAMMNTMELANGGAHGDTTQAYGIGQNLYSIYSNRSYTCTVEMMGCMQVMPMMYFQLNNIPLFRGVYMVVSVSHKIKAGDVTTIFTGVRMNKNTIGNVTFAFDYQALAEKMGIATPNSSNSNPYNKLEVGQITDWTSDKHIIEECGYPRNGINKELKGNQEQRESLLDTIKVKIHTSQTGYKEIELKANYGCASKLKAALDEIYNNKYNFTTGKVDNVNGEYFVILPYGGGSNQEQSIGYQISTYRISTGTPRPGNHDFGLAIDINRTVNPYVEKGKVSGTDSCTNIRTFNHPVVQVMKRHGYGWGRFSDKDDFMHFSYNTSYGTRDNIENCLVGH